MANTLTLTIWLILSGLLVGLIIFFVLTSKNKLVKTNQKQKSLLATMLMGAFFVGVVGVSSYFVLLIQFSGDTTGVKFPSTGPDPITLTIIQCTKSLYATPMAGLITSLLLASIGFLIVTLFRNIFVKRRIEKDLEDARIAARNVLEDLRFEKDKIAEAKAKDEALLESIGDGVVATDQNGATTVINESATDMLGWRSGDVMGKKWHDIVRVEDEAGAPISPAELPLFVALKIGATTTTDSTYYFVRKDGTRFPAAVTVTPIKLDNKIIGAVEVFRDITKEKELDRAKTEFISIASHQLRTPVSGLSWLTEALQFTSQNLNPKQKTYVKDLAMLSKRLIGLVEDLLNVSRIQLKTPLMTETSPIDMAGFIEEFIKEIGPYANSKEHTIVFNKNISKPITLEINKKSLYNVLQNLVSNAIEYSPANTAVTINLEKMDSTGSPQAGGFIKTSISNKGPTIPKNEQSNIFHRFYRAESAKKMKANGTGLGLYIIKTIIEGMGGKVGFESEEGKDTVFWFTIPMKLVTIDKDKTNN